MDFTEGIGHKQNLENSSLLPFLPYLSKKLPLIIYLYFLPYIKVIGDPQSCYHGGCCNLSKWLLRWLSREHAVYGVRNMGTKPFGPLPAHLSSELPWQEDGACQRVNLQPLERHQSLRNICLPSLAPFGLRAQLCWIKCTPFLDLISFWKTLACVLSEPAEPGALRHCSEQSSPAPDALAGYLRSPWHGAARCQFYIYQWFILPHGVTTTIVKLALCGKTRHAE